MWKPNLKLLLLRIYGWTLARARALNPLLIIRVGNEGNFEVKDIEPCQVKADKNHVLCF